MTISFLGSFIGLLFGGIIYKTIEFFSLLGKNIVTNQFDFIYELLTVWFVILIISFGACLLPCLKVYKQNIRNTLLNS
jgi:ABC-type lipoprotein release transport system permease subunit